MSGSFAYKRPWSFVLLFPIVFCYVEDGYISSSCTIFCLWLYIDKAFYTYVYVEGCGKGVVCVLVCVCVSFFPLLSSSEAKVLWFITHISPCVSQAASQGVNHTDSLWAQQIGVEQMLWTSRRVPLWQPQSSLPGDRQSQEGWSSSLLPFSPFLSFLLILPFFHSNFFFLSC